MIRTDLDQLRALNERFIHNFITNDVASHDAILHSQFLCMTPKGQRQNRADYLSYWATGFHPDVFLYWDTRDEQITIVNDVALVRATNKYIVHRDGTETTGMTTYTDTYLREGGTRLCIQAQLTAVTPEFFPADDGIVSIYLKGVKQA